MGCDTIWLENTSVLKEPAASNFWEGDGAVGSSEVLVPLYKIKLYHSPQDCNLTQIIGNLYQCIQQYAWTFSEFNR
jgi:hypothetical protein